jgi:hypothetical protein
MPKSIKKQGKVSGNPAVRLTHSVAACVLIGLAAPAPSASAVEPATMHKKAIALGRAGQHVQALVLLRELLDQYPGNYAYRRDAILIAAWSGNCRAALGDYQLLGNQDAQEDYLLATAGECLLEEGQPRHALALLQNAKLRYPKNAEIRLQLERAQHALAGQPRPRLETELASDSSDQGNREWRIAITVTQELVDRLRVYGRYLAVRAVDPQFATGDLNRIGTGVHWRPATRLTVTAGYAWDLNRANEGGVQLAADYAPTDLWSWHARYDAYSEEVPLRAKAQLISADHKEAGADFHTPDWRWEGGASVAGSSFSDGNQRAQLSTYAGYAVELAPRREQRFTVGLYQSRNSLPAGSTVYYNPVSDQTISVTYKLTHVRDSRFQRFVDHISASIGWYTQELYGTDAVYGIAYEQDFELDARSALNWRISLNSNVYDGRRESGFGAGLYYRKDF